MTLHHALTNYIKELQDLLSEPDEQALLDQAEKRWTALDYRYQVLLKFVEPLTAPQKFGKPAPAPKPETGTGGSTEPNVIVK